MLFLCMSRIFSGLFSLFGFLEIIRRESVRKAYIKETMIKEMFVNENFWSNLRENSLFLLELVIVIAAVLFLAYLAERIIKKVNKDTEKILTTRKIAVIGMFSAVAGILMVLEVPLPGIPSTHKFELGDLAGLLCGFAYGPVAGVLVAMLKVVIKLLFRPSSTAFVGEMANFLIGSSLILPATIIYWTKKSKKGAVRACIVGGISMTVFGSLLNWLYIFPTFLKMFCGGNMEALVGMGSAVNPLIKDIPTFVLFTAVPINLLKSVVVGVLTMLLYKPLRPVFKAGMKSDVKKAEALKEEKSEEIEAKNE